MRSIFSKPLLVGVLVAIFGATLLLAQIPVPYTFTAGTIIDPDQMNANFSTLGNSALNRNGGTMTGTLLVPAGTAALPGLAGSTQTSTGVRLTTNQAGMSVAGTERFLLTTTDYSLFGTSLTGNATQVSLLNGALIVGGAGTSFYGNGLVNSTGKIPDLSSSYFTAISASNFTTGTVPAARLGSGSPNNQSFLRGDNVWANVQTVYFFTPVTTTYTALISDSVITANGTFTITLYSCSGNSGRWLEIKDIGTGTVTVDGAGSETIDGALTYALVVQYQAITIACDGTTWHIL